MKTALPLALLLLIATVASAAPAKVSLTLAQNGKPARCLSLCLYASVVIRRCAVWRLLFT